MHTGTVEEKCSGMNIHTGTLEKKCSDNLMHTGTVGEKCSGNLMHPDPFEWGYSFHLIFFNTPPLFKQKFVSN
jgi:hypothetical protein